MLKSIEFTNFRNLDGKKISFSGPINGIFGNNSTGKTNILDGAKIAFAVMMGEYAKVLKSDFSNSDDTTPIQIKVELKADAIPSLQCYNEHNKQECGFIVTISKTATGRYVKTLTQLNNTFIDREILLADPKLPSVQCIPLTRIEDIDAAGLTKNI